MKWQPSLPFKERKFYLPNVNLKAMVFNLHVWSPEIDFKERENYFTYCSTMQTPDYTVKIINGCKLGWWSEQCSPVLVWTLLAHIVSCASQSVYYWKWCWAGNWYWLVAHWLETSITGSVSTHHLSSTSGPWLLIGTFLVPTSFGPEIIFFLRVLFSISCSHSNKSRCVYLKISRLQAIRNHVPGS